MFKRDNHYVKLGVTLLLVIIASTIFFVIFNNLKGFFAVISSFLSIISSVLFGIMFAFLMNPMMMIVESLMQKLLKRSNMTERGVKKLSRSIGVVVSLVSFLLIIYGLLAMVIPDVARSLEELFSKTSLESISKSVTDWVNNFAKGTFIESWLAEHNLLQMLQQWLEKNNTIFSTLENAFNGVFSVAKTLFHAIIGIIIAIYLLISKERFIAQTKKMTVAIFSKKHADRVFEIARLTNRSLGGFMVGKLIDSLIIGVLSYIGMKIFGLPYALLASVFIGVTNIIPFFGPFIGIVLGTFLILLQNPLQALYFVIFEVILQQLDANVIGPRILGERLGISDFWILVSVSLFTGLFGFAGMIFGVPVFAVIYTLIRDGVNKSLRKKRHPIQTDLYYSILCVNDLDEHRKEFGDSTVFYSEDSYDTEYDPDEDIEYDDPDEM